MWSPSINYLYNSGKTLISNEKLNQHVMKFFHKKKEFALCNEIFSFHIFF